jgi:hypothetical protein
MLVAHINFHVHIIVQRGFFCTFINLTSTSLKSMAFEKGSNAQPSTRKENMSHFTEIKTQIKDIEALRLACQELGLTLLQDTEARGYYENKTKGDYVVQLKGPYDIALNKQADGTFGLTADLWQGHVEKEVGKGYGKLLRLYGVHKAAIEARKKGLSVLRRHQQNGSIKLVLIGVS